MRRHCFNGALETPGPKVCNWRIFLKNSFRKADRNLSKPLVRPSRKELGTTGQRQLDNGLPLMLDDGAER